jgi:hypothetical protein
MQIVEGLNIVWKRFAGWASSRLLALSNAAGISYTKITVASSGVPVHHSLRAYLNGSLGDEPGQLSPHIAGVHLVLLAVVPHMLPLYVPLHGLAHVVGVLTRQVRVG